MSTVNGVSYSVKLPIENDRTKHQIENKRNIYYNKIFLLFL